MYQCGKLYSCLDQDLNEMKIPIASGQVMSASDCFFLISNLSSRREITLSNPKYYVLHLKLFLLFPKKFLCHCLQLNQSIRGTSHVLTCKHATLQQSVYEKQSMYLQQDLFNSTLKAVLQRQFSGPHIKKLLVCNKELSNEFLNQIVR